MWILAHHLHAHSLGSISEEEELLRHPVDNHLQGIPDLYMGMEAVGLQGPPQTYPWITPGYPLRGHIKKHIRTLRCGICRAGGNGGMDIDRGRRGGPGCCHHPAVLDLQFLLGNGKERIGVTL